MENQPNEELWEKQERQFFVSLGYNPATIYIILQRMKEQRKAVCQSAYALGQTCGYQEGFYAASESNKPKPKSKPKPR